MVTRRRLPGQLLLLLDRHLAGRHDGARRGSLASGSRLTPCTSSQRLRIRLKRFHGRAITRAKVYVDGRLVRTVRGRSLRSVTISGLPGSARHTIRVYPSTRKGRAKRIVKHVYGCAHHATRPG